MRGHREKIREVPWVRGIGLQGLGGQQIIGKGLEYEQRRGGQGLRVLSYILPQKKGQGLPGMDLRTLKTLAK